MTERTQPGTPIQQWERESTDLKRALAEAIGQKDRAYAERNLVVALAARLAIRAGGAAWVAEHQPKEGEEWDPKWANVVFIVPPGGDQLSWHIQTRELPLFAALPRVSASCDARFLTGNGDTHDCRWDGHTTEQKYERLRDWLKVVS